MYFNPSRLNEDNQYPINDNTSEYYTDNEFVKAFTTSNNSFSILNLIIRSISKNIGKLKEYLNIIKHNFSIITVQETWFTENSCLEYNMYNLPDYSLETINRIDCNVGGVGIYISNAVDYKVRTDLNSQNEIFESCFIEINMPNDKNIIIGSIYRHHHHSINEFNNYLEDIIKNKLIYLAGDFNIDILKNNEKYIDDFLDLIYSYSLYPPILRLTHITNKSETLIDNILTNDLNNIGGILMFDTSDHFPNFTITKKKIKLNKDEKHKMIRDFSNKNINNLKTCMNDFNWKDSLEIHGDVNSAYNEFTKIFTNMLNKFTPLKKKNTKAKTKSNLSWLTRDLSKMINKKTRLYKQYMRKRTTLNKIKYKTLNNKLNKLLRSAKRNYYSNQLEKEKKNIKNTWKISNNVLNKDHKKSCNTEFNLNGQVINNPNQIPDHFNDFFHKYRPKSDFTDSWF